jgi:hypothetical protein
MLDPSTRPRIRTGNGMVLEKAAIAGIQQLAAVYVVKDMLS